MQDNTARQNYFHHRAEGIVDKVAEKIIGQSKRKEKSRNEIIKKDILPSGQLNALRGGQNQFFRWTIYLVL